MDLCVGGPAPEQRLLGFESEDGAYENRGGVAVKTGCWLDEHEFAASRPPEELAQIAQIRGWSCAGLFERQKRFDLCSGHELDLLHPVVLMTVGEEVPQHGEPCFDCPMGVGSCSDSTGAVAPGEHCCFECHNMGAYGLVDGIGSGTASRCGPFGLEVACEPASRRGEEFLERRRWRGVHHLVEIALPRCSNLADGDAQRSQMRDALVG